ncbi:BgTH12-07141 [Blumeria graminis f. sp. triticale]|uniref:Bgt-5050 n=3 Tax=Blumeria graminis TaxID=34373 RepID=A0A9X9MPL8_BLUGR|nr:phosducin [Blumeria graminis f. sp. tritici 96224]CAD6506214.1 BgTH12-07141 [Blumeria graminis f. sp. triticale]VDB94947.1 Bgt-5050 [Blumeria graminis f. sp. tritici]
MAVCSAATEEFNNLVSKASSSEKSIHHPADIKDYAYEHEDEEHSEEVQHLRSTIDKTMRMSVCNRQLCLPHRDFDRGRTTGVKGVIADARSYEEAKRNVESRGNPGASRNQVTVNSASATSLLRNEEGASDPDDDDFIKMWRQQRHMELQGMGRDIRNRRTSPSMRRFGRFDQVDAMGYLDAIEKVARETIVVVFVYDPECPVSQAITDALKPIVSDHPAIHFVRVHYVDIEFDNAGVPAILAYKEQGKLFANLTYIIDQLPDDAFVNTQALESVLKRHHILKPI